MEKEKCFVMMPISDQGDYPEGHFTKVYEQIFKPAIKEAGYEAYRVDENVISDPIIGKIFDAIQNCPMALCDLSNRNPNVLYELGLRQAYDKPVVLVQDDLTERIFDVSGISTVQYKSARLYEHVVDAREKITNAIIETREGKKNSIIKIVKAQTAEILTGDLSKEDKMEIMLSGLAEDLRELKLSVENHNDIYNIVSSTNNRNVREGINSKSINGPGVLYAMTDSYSILLKSGISNKEIKQVIGEIENQNSIDIQIKRHGNILEVIFNNRIPSSLKRLSLEEIEKKIGRQ